MTAAPAYGWSFNSDIFGNRVPKIATLECTASSALHVGTMVSMVSGQVIATTDGTADKFIGLCAEEIAVTVSAAAPVKVAIIAPGMVIKGTAVSTAAALSGFTAKNYDVDVDGRLDPTDTTGGGLTVMRTEDAGLTVYCVANKGVMFG